MRKDMKTVCFADEKYDFDRRLTTFRMKWTLLFIFVWLACTGTVLAWDKNNSSTVDGWTIESEDVGAFDTSTPRNNSDDSNNWTNVLDQEGSGSKANRGVSPTPGRGNEETDEIINKAVSALQMADKNLFISLLDESCYKQVEAMGENFELTSAAGKAAAAGLLEAFKQAQPATRSQKIIHYKTKLEGETYGFYIVFDDDAGVWKLGGL